MKLPRFLMVTAIASLLVACSDDVSDNNTSADLTETSSPVLATVNGEAITQIDVDFMIDQTFSVNDKVFVNEAIENKVLESLIASKAISHEVLKSFPSEELDYIDLQVSKYREELYLKTYLQKFVSPEPVTQKMVIDYYQDNLDQFNGVERREFEMLTTKGLITVHESNVLLDDVEELKKLKDWKSHAASKGDELVYRRAIYTPGLLEPTLDDTVKRLTQGQTSDLVLVKGVPYLLRATKIDNSGTRLLSEVSSKIRKDLAAIQLKKAVKRVTDEVVSASEVTRN